MAGLSLAASLFFPLALLTVAPQAPSGKPVDVCALLTKAEAAAILGAEVIAANPDTPRGSVLGGCSYVTMSGLIMVTARPAGEFDASVRAYKDLVSVEGVGTGVKASYSPTVGLLMSQTGKPYFLQIGISGAAQKTNERFIAIARKIIAKS